MESTNYKQQIKILHDAIEVQAFVAHELGWVMGAAHLTNLAHELEGVYMTRHQFGAHTLEELTR